MEEKEKRLYDAALRGNANTFREILQKDELALDRVSLSCFQNYTPLHIAAMRGNLSIVQEIVSRKPELSVEQDSRQKSTALHIASAKGHLGIVQSLVNSNPDICWAGDRDGRNPLHHAAMNGNVEVLKVLFDARPLAAREKTNRGETVLHLCVKYNQLEALTALVETIDDDEFLNEKNGDGLTMLHLAVISKQIEIIRYLLNTNINVNVKNANGNTALDILPKSLTERQEIENSLRRAGALRANEITQSRNLNGTTRPNTLPTDANSQALNDTVVPADARSPITPLPSTQGANLVSNSPWSNSVNGTTVSNHLPADANSRAPNDTAVAADAQCPITPLPSSQGANLLSNSSLGNTVNVTTVSNHLPADANSQAPNDAVVPADAQSPITPLPSTKGANLLSNSPPSNNVNGTTVSNNLPAGAQSQIIPSPSRQGASNFTEGRWLEQKSKALMVVASLIATMAFQAAVSPAGGVWQDDLTNDSQGNPAPNPHTAGQSVMAYHHLTYYKYFLRTNTTAFVSSLSTILLLISGLPFKNKFFLWILMVVMWLTVTTIAATYAISLAVITPATDWEQLGHVIEVSFIVWCCLITLVLLGKTFYFIHKSLKQRGINIWRLRRSGNSAVVNPGNANQIAIQMDNHPSS